jgi:hypothetical protein
MELNSEHLVVINKFIEKCQELLNKFNSFYEGIKWHNIRECDARIYLYYDAELDLVKKCLEKKILRTDIVFNLILCRLFIFCATDKIQTDYLFDTYEYKWWKLTHENKYLIIVSDHVSKSNWKELKKILGKPIPHIYKELPSLYYSNYIE